MDRGLGVGRPGVDQRHANVGILGKPRRHHAAGGSGAHDDVVVHLSSLQLTS